MKKNCNKVPVRVKTEEDVDSVIQNIENGRICPVFAISNTTGECVDTLRSFLGRLPKVVKVAQAAELVDNDQIQTKFIVDSRHFCKGIGLILAGTVLKGTIKLNQELMFGPDKNGSFTPVMIKGIHENRVDIAEAPEMSSITVAIKMTGKNNGPTKMKHIRKGQCLINPITHKTKGYNPYQSVCIKYFDAQMKILHHATTIQEGYQAVLHMGGVRSTVQAVSITKEGKQDGDGEHHLRNGDSGIIRFKFKYGVELIDKGAKLMVREGNTKAFGFVKETFPMNQPPSDLDSTAFIIRNEKKKETEDKENQIQS